MLIQIAWRNVWRNRKRSLIILGAIAFGIWAGLFSMGMMRGMYAQMVESGVATRLGHLQIHAEGYRKRPDIEKTIPNGMAVLREVRTLSGVKAATARALVNGMASSPHTAAGVQVVGIRPDEDARVFDVNTRLTRGDWFVTGRRNPVVIGAKLAEKLDVTVGKKVVLQAQASDGSIGAGAFRVVGLYRTASSAFDERTVFALREDVQRIFGLDGSIHEIAVRLAGPAGIGEAQSALQRAFPDLAVETWKEISPELAVTTDMGDQMLYIFMVLILLALVFGITNTMLMGVLERVRELGVLKALGLKGSRMFAMVLLETVVLSVAGGAVGIAAGMGTIAFFARNGIDLSVVSEGLAAFGMGTVVYPALAWDAYVNVTAMVVLTALVSAVYPGVKAVRLNTVQAIRTY